MADFVTARQRIDFGTTLLVNFFGYFSLHYDRTQLALSQLATFTDFPLFQHIRCRPHRSRAQRSAGAPWRQ